MRKEDVPLLKKEREYWVYNIQGEPHYQKAIPTDDVVEKIKQIEELKNKIENQDYQDMFNQGQIQAYDEVLGLLRDGEKP